MATAAKFTGTTAVTLADFGGEPAGFPELVLSGAHTAVVATITLTANVPAYWPTAGWVTIDTEIIAYTGKAGATLTGCTRGAQSGYSGSVAAAHSDGAKVGPYLTPQTVAQIEAEIIAMQTATQSGAATNYILNSDFSRRTVFGLAMAEGFADTSGYVVVSGAAPTVASNIVTSTAANELAWCNQSFVWRDGRASGSFKAVAIAGIYQIKLKLDATHFISAKQNNGNFTIVEQTGAGDNVLSTTANVLTINRWYWIEVELQGTKVIAKIYDTTVTTPGTVKGTLAPMVTLNQTTSFANTGATVATQSDQALAQWGGIATGNGGVYVETWLPESWVTTFSGTLGGLAIGFDEAVDTGPLSKQWTMRAYVPATSRQATLEFDSSDGSVPPSVSAAASMYMKVSGYGGSSELVEGIFNLTNSALAPVVQAIVANGTQTTWTRISSVAAGISTVRRAQVLIQINVSATATGTAYFMLPQLEQGSVATAWRNAPADEAPIIWEFAKTAGTSTTTSGTLAEIDPRDLAGNLFIPWAASLDLRIDSTVQNSGANANLLAVSVAAVNKASNTVGSVAGPYYGGYGIRAQVAAGKTRVAALFATGAGTMTFQDADAAGGQHSFRVTAYRGK